jgi:methyl-accepting chemotaxis protein
LFLVPIGIGIQNRLLNLDAQLLFGISQPYILFFQDLLIVAATFYLSQRYFNKQLKVGIDHLQNIVQAEQIDLTARLPINKKNKLTGLWSSVNELLTQSEKVISDLIASVSRLIPMAQELTDTYSAITQKATMQAEISKVVDNAIQEVYESNSSIILQTDEIKKLNSILQKLIPEVEDNKKLGFANKKRIKADERDFFYDFTDKIESVNNYILKNEE